MQVYDDETFDVKSTKNTFVLNWQQLFAEEGLFFSYEEYLAKKPRNLWNKTLEQNYIAKQPPFNSSVVNLPKDSSGCRKKCKKIFCPKKLHRFVMYIKWFNCLTGNVRRDSQFVNRNNPEKIFDWFWLTKREQIRFSDKYPKGGTITKNRKGKFYIQHNTNVEIVPDRDDVSLLIGHDKPDLESSDFFSK